MLDHKIPTDGKPTNTSDPAELLALLSRPPGTTASDVLPIAPNLIATFVSFGFMVVVPWLVLWVIDWLIDHTFVDDIDPGFVAFAMGVSLVVALVAALLFLVIGMVLQFWQHHKPFASWWPVVLAFPVTGGLLLPEVWVRGDSVRYWMMVGSAIALAFSVHWMALVVAREAME